LIHWAWSLSSNLMLLNLIYIIKLYIYGQTLYERRIQWWTRWFFFVQLFSYLPFSLWPSDRSRVLFISTSSNALKLTHLPRYLYAETGDLVSEFNQQTARTLQPVGRPPALRQACRPCISSPDALKCPYSDCMRLFVRHGNRKCHLQNRH
jgi:hypothetical protein